MFGLPGCKQFSSMWNTGRAAEWRKQVLHFRQLGGKRNKDRSEASHFFELKTKETQTVCRSGD